ncbi:MAG: FAD/NAD(P)-binding protein [Pseudomonadota bacterium]
MARSSHDKSLGMHASISRRDLFHGVGALALASAVPGRLFAADGDSGVYPPALMGMRGNHDGSFEVAHALAMGGNRDFGPAKDGGDVDLAIVGAGISGLAAAWFYRQQHPEARILVLDNHDDFGGHSKRNEFNVDGQTLIGYGGGQTLVEPSEFPPAAARLLDELGVRIDRFNTAYDHEFYRRHGLGPALHFSEAAWGKSKLVRTDPAGFRSYLFLADNSLSPEEAVLQMPIAAEARKQMLRLLTLEDQYPDLSDDEKIEWLFSLSYKDYLADVVGVDHPDVLRILDDCSVEAGPGIAASIAETAVMYYGLPGGNALGLEFVPDEEPYIHHFPDGNASIARLMVREMIPGIADGSDMEDVVTTNFDYSRLDAAGQAVRIRLNSTVVQAANTGRDRVSVSYINDGQLHELSAKHCVMACNNRIIPSLCPELGDAQADALRTQVKRPLIYTNVALRNWRAWAELGVGVFASPGEYHWNAKIDFPVSLGDYAFSATPDEPVIVHMERFLGMPNKGLSKKQQFQAGRAELLNTSFDSIERNVRSQLADALGPGGFDPARDIAGITVNRWSHGYSWSYDFLGGDPWYDDWNDPRYPHVKGRQPFGNIAIANADAGAVAWLHVAVEQAHRAVSELES